MENFLVLNSNRQKKENMSRYVYNTGVAPNSGHKDKLHCEAVKIQIIFRYMGKHLYKDRAVINNNCYRLIAFETAFENKEQRFMHSCLTFQCETKRIIQSKLRAGLQLFVCS